MKLSRTIIFTLALTFTMALIATRLGATIANFNQIQIDFTNAPDAAIKATWSEPDQLTITMDGLGWDGEAASSRDGWIQTTPQALGLSWRPTFTAAVRVAIRPLPAEYVLNDGQKSTPYAGDVFVRYSPDLKHWSSWQVLQPTEPLRPDEKENPGRLFSGTVRVPYVEREAYGALLNEYSKLDVPWASDEEAAVQWILQKDPDFFSKHLPFIGYIQIRFEGGFHGSQRIKSFKADVSYAMGGMHIPPKDMDVYKERDSSPWRFKAKDETKSSPSTH